MSWRALMELDADQRPSIRVDQLKPCALETVLEGASLWQVAEKMVTQKVGALPIVDGRGDLVGIVSRTDLMRAIVERLQAR